MSLTTEESLETLAERVRGGLDFKRIEPSASARIELERAEAALATLLQRAKETERLATENGRLAQTHWDRAEAAEARERKLREALPTPLELAQMRKTVALFEKLAALRSLDSEGGG